MSDLATLLAFWTAFSLAVMSPGPNFAVILGTALGRGRRSALHVALGMASGEAIWGMAAMFGVSLVITEIPLVGLVLQIAGGLFLIGLALVSLRSAARRDVVVTAAPAAEAVEGGRRGYARGLAVMVFNPKAGVFWISLASVFTTAGASDTLALIAVGGAVAISLCWHLGLAFALSAASVVAVYRRARRGMDAVLGVVLAGLGCKLLLDS